MRIKFNRIDPTDIKTLSYITSEYDIISQVYPHIYTAFDKCILSDIQTYTDNARYTLNLYQIDFDRCYAVPSVARQIPELISDGNIQVFEIEFNFNLDVDFKLFQEVYTRD